MSSIVRMERRGRGLKREEGPSFFHLDAGMGKLARTCTYLFCHLFIPFFFFYGKKKKTALLSSSFRKCENCTEILD